MIIYKLRKYFFYYFFILFISCTNNQVNEEVTFSDEKITWSKHIAPILFKNCTSCHRPGESGPFNLLNYSDATKKAKLIKFVTQTGFMPPWPADVNYSHFVGERVLKKSNTFNKLLFPAEFGPHSRVILLKSILAGPFIDLYSLNKTALIILYFVKLVTPGSKAVVKPRSEMVCHFLFSLIFKSC